jgi:DNA-binding response OmpR family regulator
VTVNDEFRVLVVDDDRFFLRVLEKRFLAEGYEVRTAADGREGMAAIVTWEPDLVISDWMMPEVDGLELCQAVKTGLREAAPYFVLLTAKGELSDQLLGLDTGADDFLVKPCDHAELMARVRAGLRIVKLTRELRRAVCELTESNAHLKGAREELVRLVGMRAACPSCPRVLGLDGAWTEAPMSLDPQARAVLPAAACPECAEGERRAA